MKPVKVATRAVEAFLEEVRAAARHAGRPLAEGACSGLAPAKHDFLKAFDTSSAEAFVAVATLTLPALMQRVADVAFGLADGHAARSARTAVRHDLADMPLSGVQEQVAKQLHSRFSTLVEGLSKELQSKQDRELQRQLLSHQFKPAPSGSAQPGGVLQPSTGHNRQGRATGICFDWDGARCHGKGKDCPYDHPIGKPSTICLKKLAGGSRGRVGF